MISIYQGSFRDVITCLELLGVQMTELVGLCSFRHCWGDQHNPRRAVWVTDTSIWRFIRCQNTALRFILLWILHNWKVIMLMLDDVTLCCGRSWAKFNFFCQTTLRYLLDHSASSPPLTKCCRGGGCVFHTVLLSVWTRAATISQLSS